MTIRKNSTNEFELYPSNWFMIVYLKGKKLMDEDYTGAKRNKKKIIERIKNLQKKKIPFKIYGVWHGDWSTDAFDLNPKKLIKNIEADMNDK